MPSFGSACTRDRLCCQRRGVAVPRGCARRILADQPATSLTSAGEGRPSGDGGRRRRPGQERGGVAAGYPPRAARPGLPGGVPRFVVDDNSDDGTGAIAAELGEKAARDGGVPLTVVKGQPRPDGWAGKVWAMARGLAATGEADAGRPGAGEATAGGPAPDYVLFTDADIAWSPPALRDLVRAAQADNRALVSQMALLRAETRWERVIVPAFVYFFARLPVPPGQRPEERYRRGGRRLHAHQQVRARGGRRAGTAQGRADRRRGARHAAQEARQSHLARADHGYQECSPLPEPGQLVAHDRPVGVRAAQVQPATAGRHDHRPAAALRRPAGRRARRAGGCRRGDPACQSRSPGSPD